MKLQTWMAAVIAGVGLNAQGALYTYNWTGINAAIPDANPSGYVNNQTISDSIQGNIAFLPNPYVVNVTEVRIQLTGGWNGDLYAYLRHETTGGTGFTTLLNRVGTESGNPIGYTTAGMNVKLIEGAGLGNIHSVQSPTSGESYQVDSTGSSTTFNSFQGLDPNGTWSLFFADLSGNNVSTLNSWGLTLEVVPEPANVALGIFGGIGGIVGLVRWRSQKKRMEVKC